MFALCRLSPDHTWRIASTVAPLTWAAASCMCGKTGLSSLPSPYVASYAPGCRPAACTASISAGECTVASRSSEATGAGTTRSPSSTPRSPASRIVSATRSGDIGCSGPKSYSPSVPSKTTDAGPHPASMALTLVP